MKGFSSKAQASTILAAALTLTLFASQAALAGDPAKKAKASEASVGTNGGGGGSVILCPGQAPVLTDLWEAERSTTLNFVNGTATERLQELRKLSAAKVRDVLAENFDSYLAAKSGEEKGLRNNLMFVKYLLAEVEQSALKAILLSTKVSFESSQDKNGLEIIEVVVDKNAKDPKDSGVVKGLNGSGCVEERVAVTSTDFGGGPQNKPRVTTIRILRPDLYMAMPPLDKYSLLMGHEFIHSESEGNVANIEAIGKSLSNSEDVRRLNAWITLGQAQDFIYSESRPQGDRVVNCAANSPGSSRTEWLAEYMHFKLYLRANASDTVVEIENFKNINLWQSVFTRLPLEEKNFLIPKDINTNIKFFGGETGKSFDFKLEIPNEFVQGKLLQMNLGHNYFRDPSGARKTNFTLQFVQGPDKSVMTQVLNSQGQIEFSGETHCYKK